ncbi:MAG: hypothetical protein IVW36_11700 [Dehalococcoidia bacterium]|nr:hypothetical protein [Dehalococcoidia bacterium]
MTAETLAPVETSRLMPTTRRRSLPGPVVCAQVNVAALPAVHWETASLTGGAAWPTLRRPATSAATTTAAASADASSSRRAIAPALRDRDALASGIKPLPQPDRH